MDFRKLLEAGFAQVNPFDNGADFNSTMRKPASTAKATSQQRPAPARTPAPGQARASAPMKKPQTFRPNWNRAVQGIPNSFAEFTTEMLPKVGEGAVAALQGVARAPESLVRSVAGLPFADKHQDLLTSNKVAGIPGTEGLAKTIYGDQPIKTYQQQAQELKQAARTSSNPNIRRAAPFAPFAAPLLAAGDATALSGVTAGATAAAKRAPAASQRVSEAYKASPMASERGSIRLPGEPAKTPPPTTRARGFTESLKESPEVSTAVQKATKGTYKTRNTEALAERADAFASQPSWRAFEDISNRLAVKQGQINDTDVADAIATAKRLDADGQSEQASHLYEDLAGHLTKQGQSVQAASLLNHRTPEGIKFQGERTLKRAGIEITADLRKRLGEAHAAIRKTKVGSPERDYAIKAYSKVISDNLPTDLADKGVAFWKAGLLTGVKTQTGNALSNATFGALHSASDPLASILDRGASLITGQRSKATTLAGRGQGLLEGVDKGKQVLRTGIDERAAITNKFDQHQEINFGNSPAGRAATTYVNGVFRLMGAADRPAYYSQLRNSLHDLARVSAGNQRIPSSQRAAYIKNFVENPPKDALQTATNEAEKAVLGNDTFLSNWASRTRQAADQIENPLARNATKTIIGGLAPFTKVPSAFISRVLDFTPVGAVKTAAEQIARGRLDQRALVTALSEATTGSSLIYLGAELANNDMLSGDFPDDPKEQARWKAEGIQPNSVKVGDTWYSLNYFGPLGSLFAQGKRVVDNLDEGSDAVATTADATFGIARDALDQSFLQGVSGALDAVTDPKRYAESFLRNQTASVVPTLVKDVAEATDPMQREVMSVLDAVQARVPGVRQGLAEKQDVYGNKLEAKASPLDLILNPLRPSNQRHSSSLDEVARLNESGYAITPTPVDKALKINKQTVKLTDEQRYKLQEAVGQKTQGLWQMVIPSEKYQQLDDEHKAKLLEDLRADATKLVKVQFAKSIGLDPGDLTARQEKLESGLDLADYDKKKPKSKKAKATKTSKAKGRVAKGRKSGGGKGRKRATFKPTKTANAGINETSKRLGSLLANAKVRKG